MRRGIERNLPTAVMAGERAGADGAAHSGTKSIAAVAIHLPKWVIDRLLVIVIGSLTSLKVDAASIAAPKPVANRIDSMCPHNAGGLTQHQMRGDYFADTRQFIVGTLNESLHRQCAEFIKRQMNRSQTGADER